MKEIGKGLLSQMPANNVEEILIRKQLFGIYEKNGFGQPSSIDTNING